jgi:hypothetical protein
MCSVWEDASFVADTSQFEGIGAQTANEPRAAAGSHHMSTGGST